MESQDFFSYTDTPFLKMPIPLQATTLHPTERSLRGPAGSSLLLGLMSLESTPERVYV